MHHTHITVHGGFDLSTQNTFYRTSVQLVAANGSIISQSSMLTSCNKKKMKLVRTCHGVEFKKKSSDKLKEILRIFNNAKYMKIITTAIY